MENAVFRKLSARHPGPVGMRSWRKRSWGVTARGGLGCFPPPDDSGSRDQEQLSSAGRGQVISLTTKTYSRRCCKP